MEEVSKKYTTKEQQQSFFPSKGLLKSTNSMQEYVVYNILMVNTVLIKFQNMHWEKSVEKQQGLQQQILITRLSFHHHLKWHQISIFVNLTRCTVSNVIKGKHNFSRKMMIISDFRLHPFAINFFIKPIIDAHRRKNTESVTEKAKYNRRIAPTKIRYK